MVRSADIIADRLGRIGAEEDRAGVGDLAGDRLGVIRYDLEMLRREAVDERQRGLRATGTG